MEAQGSWRHRESRVFSTQEPFIKETRRRNSKAAHKENQNIHLAQDCIQPLFSFYMALLKCLSYLMNTSAPPGSVMIYISHQTSAKLYANQTQSKVCWHWNGKISTCILFEYLKSDIKRLLKEFWIAMKLWSYLKSPSGQMTHVHMFLLQAGTKLKMVVLGFISPMRL